MNFLFREFCLSGWKLTLCPDSTWNATIRGHQHVPLLSPFLPSSSPSWLPHSWVSRVICTSIPDEICPSSRQPFPPPLLASTLLQKPTGDVPFPSLSSLLQAVSPWFPSPVSETPQSPSPNLSTQLFASPHPSSMPVGYTALCLYRSSVKGKVAVKQSAKENILKWWDFKKTKQSRNRYSDIFFFYSRALCPLQ